MWLLDLLMIGLVSYEAIWQVPASLLPSALLFPTRRSLYFVISQFLAALYSLTSPLDT